MKKLGKIIFNFILIALFLIIFSNSSNAAATVGKRFSLKMTGSDGVDYSIAYVITSLDPAEVMLDDCENGYVGDFVVPSQVTYENTNYTVTGLGDYNGFWLCSDITTITIPETIRYIEDESKIPFQSGSLTAINVNSNNQYFTSTNGVLYNKDKTELIRYPENKTDLTSYTIPSSVSLIKAGAFYDCDALKTITIPNTVTEIEEKAFYSCGGATTINLNAQITVINTSVFSGCSSLKTITIPSTVTEIGKSAFSSCSALTSLTIPTSVTTIGDSAFSSCSALTGITIPASVTTIGSSVFNSCTSLTAINVNTSNSNYSSTNGILFNKDKTTLIRYPQGKVDVTTYTIPSTVVEIAESGFYYCNTLTKITIPNTVTTLGTRAFYYCEGLTSMNVPESITTLPTYVFGYCKNMTSVILPDTLTNIGGDAFYYCTNLATIDIPEKITKINSYAFYCCEKLDNITIKSNIKEIGSDAFSNCKALKNLNLQNGIEIIGDGAFYNCTTLASLTIPESVISIGEDAFYNNTSLTTIVVPKTVTTIGETAFPVTTEMYVRDESAALEYAVANTNPYTIIPELEWKIIGSSLNKSNKKMTITIQGGSEIFKESNLEKDDITVYLKNDTNTFVEVKNIREISCSLSTSSSITNGVQYTLTLENFGSYEGEVGLQIEAGTLIDDYGYTNDKSEILEVTDNVADFVSPTVGYKELKIDQDAKTLYLEIELKDNYYSYSDIEKNDVTIYVDGNINANNLINDYKTINKVSDISGVVNGVSKKIGETYSLLITNLDKITDTGVLNVEINQNVIYDSSRNSNIVSEMCFADIVIDFIKPQIEVVNSIINQDMQNVSVRLNATENYNISGTNLDTNKILVYTKDSEGNYVTNSNISKKVTSKKEIKNSEEIANSVEYVIELSNFGKYSGSIAIEFLEGAIEDTLGNKNEFTRQVEIKESTDWRIFYNDGNNIFIIAEDVLPTSMITTENIETQDSYKAYWTDVYTDTVDESDIDFEKFMFSNTFLETNQNYIQISTLLKTGNWENLTNQIYADSAIGSPTLEMFLSSWNEKYPDDRIYYHKMNENGYYIGTVEDYEICENTNALDALSNTAGTNLNFSQFEGATDELYFGTDTDTQGYWIASPSPWVFDMCIYYSLNTGNWSCSSGNGSNRGIRPVVCIKENTLGTKIGDTWSINTTNGENLAETISAENYGDYIDYPVVLKDNILTVDFVEFADLKYSYDDINKTATVTGVTEGVELVGEYAIPSEVVNPEDGENYTIIEIGMNSFSGVSQMTKIRLPDTITNIEVGAFADCTALKEIDTSKNLVRISAFALSGSGLEEIYIPKSVSDITSLTFEACDKLKSIVVEEENPYYTDNDGVLFNKDETLLIRFPSNKELESYTVPDSVKILNCEAFYNCFNLREITIPANVNQIEYGCFLGCNNLNEINFSEGLKEIGNHAFMTCNSLEEIILPESLTSLESYAFSNCINLKSIKISLNDANLQEKLIIGDTVFEYCSEELTIETRLNSSAHIYAVDNGIDYEIMDVASTEIDGATYGYLTFEEAFEASEENGTITLLEDLEVTKETVLDLENKTISGNIKNTSNLILKNGTINGTITNDGTLTTENIEIVSDTYALTTSAATTMDAEDIVFNINLGTILKGKEKAINNNISLLECTVNIPEGYALMTEIDGEYEVSNLEEKCISLKIFLNNTVEEWKKGDINKDGLVTNFDALLFGRILAGWTSVEKEYFDLDDDGVISESEEENFVYICDIDENNKVSNPDLTDMMRNVVNLNGDYEPNKFYKDESITFSGYTEPENQEVTWKVEDIDEEGNSLGTSNRATINSTTGKFTAIDTGLVKITVTSKTDSEVTDVLVLDIVEKCTEIRILVDGTAEEWKKGDINKDGCISNFDTDILSKLLIGVEEIKIFYFDIDGDGVISESEEENYLYICDVNEDGKISITDSVTIKQGIVGFENVEVRNILYKDDTLTFKPYTEPENQEAIWSVTDIELDSENNIIDLETNTRATIDSQTGELTALDTGLVEVTVTSKTTPTETDSLVVEIKERTSRINIYVNNKVENPELGDINRDGYITNLDAIIVLQYDAGYLEEIKSYRDLNGDGVISEEEENEFLKLADITGDGLTDIGDAIKLLQISETVREEKDNNKVYKNESIPLLAITEPEGDVVTWSVEDIDEEGNSLGTSARATINLETGDFTALDIGFVKIIAKPKSNTELTTGLVLEIIEKCEDIRIYNDVIVNESIVGDLNRDGLVTSFDSKIFAKILAGNSEEKNIYFDLDGDGIISESEEENYMYVCDTNQSGNIDINDYAISHMWPTILEEESAYSKIYKDDVISLKSYTEPENQEVIWTVTDIGIMQLGMDNLILDLETNERATIDSATGKLTALDVGLIEVTATSKTTPSKTDTLLLEIKERTSKINTYVNQTVDNPEIGDLNRDGLFTDLDSSILIKVVDGHDLTEYKDIDGDGNISESEETEFFRLCDINSDGEIKVFDTVKLLQKIQQVKTTGENAKFYKNETITFSAITTPEGDDIAWSVEDMDEEGNSLGTSNRATINSTTGEFTALDKGFVKITAVPKTNTSLSSYFILEISEYTITYDLDGGSLETGKQNPETYNVNDSFTLNNPSKVGHTFIGWTGDGITEPVINLTIEPGTKGNKSYKANYSVNTYYLFINYYEPLPGLGGASLLREYVEQHKYGEEFKVISPELIGYTPDIAVVEGIMEANNMTFEVTYIANSDTKYTVEHYLQNLENDDYTLYETEGLEGTTDSYTCVAPRKIDGFTGLEVSQDIIEPDGSTVIKVYYDRNYYTVTVKYLYEDGTEVLPSVDQKVKYNYYFIVGAQPVTGYTSDQMIYERTITGDTNLEFVYSPNIDTQYTVQHYRQNVENDDYTLVETENKTGTTDTNTEAISKEYEGFTAQEILQQNIDGNGKSIVEVYYDRNSYQLTYKVDGVQHGEIESYKFEAPITPRENPSKTGYKFSGWNGVPEIMPANNVEITGTFIVDDGQTKELSYTVEYYKNGTKVESDTQTVKQIVQLLNPDVLTVDKSSININDKYLGYECDTSITVIPDTIENGGVIKVYYNIVTYKITYTSALGEFPEWFNPPTSYTVEDSVTIENPYVTGYDFMGWSGTNIDTVVNNILLEKGTTGDLDFFANYEIKYYQLSYTLDGYSYGEVKTCAYGERIIPEPDPEVYGYKFSGWNNLPETMPANDVEVSGTLIVDDTQRKDISYKVEYYKDRKLADTDTVVENVQVLINELTVDNSQINITDKYYGYRYEKTEPVVIPETISDGGVIKVFYVLDDGNTKTLNYKVEYYKDGVLVPEDTQVETKTVQILENDILTVDKSKINVTDKYLGYLCSGTEPSQIPDTISTGNTIKVNYTAIPYEISYMLDGGNVQVANPEFYTINDSFTLNNPEKVGHTFIGWTGNGITEPTINLTVETGTMGNIVFDAHYSVNQYELQINYIGIPTDKGYGPLSFSKQYNYGEIFSVTSPDVPGYTPSIAVVEGVMEARTMTYEVTYTPNTDTEYIVHHFKQNIENDGYAMFETEVGTGTTDTLTNVIPKVYEGFKAKEIEQNLISGDPFKRTIIHVYYDRNLYNLTYKVDGVQDGEVETYKYEAPITPRENPSKLGYKFSGWNSVPETMPANDVEVSGIFSIDDEQRKDISYKVEYYKDGKITDTDVFTQNVQVLSNTLTVDKSQINVTDKYLGYSFEKTEPELIPETIENESVIKVYYMVNNYIISYDLDGGSFGDITLMWTNTYTVNNAFKLGNPTKEGYTFIGWTENEGDIPEIDKEIPVGSTGNKTFKAHYAINSYNLEISYVYEDGREIAPKYTEAIEYNSDYSVNTPVIPGYTADISVVSGTMEAENKSVVVTYRPNANTPYKVEHYKQNVENNEYTLIDTENMSGTTDTDTMAIAKEYEGFTVGEIVNVKISGNGDSIAKVYYTRNSYNYQVRYFYDNVENEENRATISALYESTINIYDNKVITGYGLDKTENLPLTIKIAEEENIINVYYVRQQYEYTVHYFFDGVEKVEAKETGNALFGNVIEEYQDKAEYGYKFERTENYPLKVTEISENNSINVYYIRKDSNVIVEYRDLVTNEEISEKVIKQAKVFDSFDVSEDVKEIEGYTLIERPEVLIGEYSEEEQTKVYKYAKNSQVKVNYLEKDTDAILAESTIINGYETKDYETKAKQIENYTFVECENPKGKMGREEIVVNYYYAQNTKVTVNYIDMYTNEILETVVQDGIVGDEYSSKSKEIDNYVLVEKPEQEEVTMQKEEIVLNYYYVMISKGVIEKHIDLVTNEIIHTAVHEGNENDPYKIEPLSQEEYILVEDKLPTNAEGLMEKNAIIVTYFYMRKASVKVIYVDELTQEVLSEEIIEGYESKAYKAQEKAFEGYSLTVRPDKSEGAMKVTKDEEGNVHTETILTYKYRKVSGGVIEKHYDIKTNEVLAEKVYSGLENDSYKIEPKVFEGYDIYEEKMPENAEGLMKQDVIEVNYYYIRKATVKIEYINVNTNEKIVDDIILNRHEGDEYKSERKKFASYVVLEERLPEKESGIIEITKDEEGNLITEINIKYYYARKTSIRVEYIDKNSSEKISKDYVLEGYEGQDYKVEAKEIEGYKLLDEQENAEGKMTKDELVVKFYYEKIKVEEPEDNKQEEQPEKDPSEESPVEPPKEENPGEKPGDTEGDKEESQTITSNIYAVKENRISKIISGTSIAELKKNIVADGNIMILSKDGKEVKDDEIVKTGMKLKLENNEEYSLIVRGDISCDGKISLTDLSKLILHYNEKKGFILSDSPYYAADLNHDDKVSIIDVSQMLILYNSI